MLLLFKSLNWLWSIFTTLSSSSYLPTTIAYRSLLLSPFDKSLMLLSLPVEGNCCSKPASHSGREGKTTSNSRKTLIVPPICTTKYAVTYSVSKIIHGVTREMKISIFLFPIPCVSVLNFFRECSTLEQENHFRFLVRIVGQAKQFRPPFLTQHDIQNRLVRIIYGSSLKG